MLDSFAVVRVDGLRASQRRAVAFLVSKDRHRADAQDIFSRLNGNRLREVRSRFDYWIEGGRNSQYFHGWPDHPKYLDCWVFKWKDNKQRHRFYGFLCHPYRSTDPQFQLCILVLHAKKSEWNTDTAELDRVAALKGDPRVAAAVAREFVDKKGARERCLN